MAWTTHAALQTVFRSVVIAKLTYALSAWWDFATTTDRQRLQTSTTMTSSFDEVIVVDLYHQASHLSMNCVERLTTNCLPVSPTENMRCMSFFLPSRLHHRTITYGRASITSNFPTKLVISQYAILCNTCYFSIPTDVPPCRVIFIIFHLSIYLSFSHTLKEFNKNT